MVLTREDVEEWRKNDVTVQLISQIKDRVEEAKDQLCGPTNDRDFDQFVKGMIRGFTEVLELQLDVSTEDMEYEISERDADGQSYS